MEDRTEHLEGTNLGEEKLDADQHPTPKKDHLTPKEVCQHTRTDRAEKNLRRTGKHNTKRAYNLPGFLQEAP
jgi:hypothetical protein